MAFHPAAHIRHFLLRVSPTSKGKLMYYERDANHDTNDISPHVGAITNVDIGHMKRLEIENIRKPRKNERCKTRTGQFLRIQYSSTIVPNFHRPYSFIGWW